MKKVIAVILPALLATAAVSEAAVYKGQREFHKQCKQCHDNGQEIASSAQRNWSCAAKRKFKNIRFPSWRKRMDRWISGSRFPWYIQTVQQWTWTIYLVGYGNKSTRSERRLENWLFLCERKFEKEYCVSFDSLFRYGLRSLSHRAWTKILIEI